MHLKPRPFIRLFTLSEALGAASDTRTLVRRIRVAQSANQTPCLEIPAPPCPRCGTRGKSRCVPGPPRPPPPPPGGRGANHRCGPDPPPPPPPPCGKRYVSSARREDQMTICAEPSEQRVGPR